MEFSRDEEFLMMLYSPGSRLGLVEALQQMCKALILDDPDDANLYILTNSVLSKLDQITDVEFDQMDLYRYL